MEPRTTTLPDDIDALKAMVFARDEIVRTRDAEVAELQEQLSSRAIEIEHLKLTIAKLRRMQFGRKSEKLDRQIEQLELKLEDLLADEGAAAAAAPRTARAPRETPAREPLPAHLERDERVHLPTTDDCPQCGGTLKPLGEDVSEQLEYVRAHFRVIRHRRPKQACSCCDCIVQAPAPSRPIERGLPGPGLLAHIVASKFVYHLPFYRQSVMYAHDGVRIEPGTMGHWLGALTWLLNPLVEAIRHYVLGGGKVHNDDTPLPVLAPGNGRTKTGRLWVCVRDDRNSASIEAPAVWFAYSPDRGGEHPQAHLKHFRGLLQADAFGGYAKLYRDGNIQEVACWAHARRQIYELHERRPNAFTEEALRRIGAIYAVEDQIRGKPPDERRRVRQAQALPLLDELKCWFEATLTTLSAKSETTAAINYALNRWAALVYYCSDGRAEIDNLIAERALRGVALGRRNYLFVGADSGDRHKKTLNGSLSSTRKRGATTLPLTGRKGP